MLRRLISKVVFGNNRSSIPDRSASSPSEAAADANQALFTALHEARAHEDRGDAASALAAYRACAERFPNSAAAQLGLANVYAELWRMDECISSYSRAFALEP